MSTFSLGAHYCSELIDFAPSERPVDAHNIYVITNPLLNHHQLPACITINKSRSFLYSLYGDLKLKYSRVRNLWMAPKKLLTGVLAGQRKWIPPVVQPVQVHRRYRPATYEWSYIRGFRQANFMKWLSKLVAETPIQRDMLNKCKSKPALLLLSPEWNVFTFSANNHYCYIFNA